jgi:hypothetical protein
VIVLAALLLLVAVGLLAGGLAQGSAQLQWGSFAASALAAVVLLVSELRRRKTADQDEPAPPVSAPPPGSAGPATGPLPAAGAATGPTFARIPAATGATGVLGPLAAEPPTGPLPAVAPETGEGVVPSTGAHARPPAGPTTGAHARPPATGAHSAEQPAAPVLGPDGEPLVEEVEVTDLLLVLDLTDDVLVVDEHPRYHLADCPHLFGAATIPVPMDEARTDGFTPCATCAPDRTFAQRERSRRGY